MGQTSGSKPPGVGEPAGREPAISWARDRSAGAIEKGADGAEEIPELRAVEPRGG
jgi:hypothetical protein